MFKNQYPTIFKYGAGENFFRDTPKACNIVRWVCKHYIVLLVANSQKIENIVSDNLNIFKSEFCYCIFDK